MMIDPQIATRLKLTLSVRTPGALDAHGAVSTWTTRTMPCRVVEVDDVVTQANGTQISTTHEILTEAEVLPADWVKWGAYDYRKVQAIQVGADILTGVKNLWRLKV